jgi:hypothetical protein
MILPNSLFCLHQGIFLGSLMDIIIEIIFISLKFLKINKLFENKVNFIRTFFFFAFTHIVTKFLTNIDYNSEYFSFFVETFDKGIILI